MDNLAADTAIGIQNYGFAIGHTTAQPSNPIPTMPASYMMRPVSIEECNRGFIVKVGCHTFAFSRMEEVIANVSEYLRDPIGVEKLWHSGKFLNDR